MNRRRSEVEKRSGGKRKMGKERKEGRQVLFSFSLSDSSAFVSGGVVLTVLPLGWTGPYDVRSLWLMDGVQREIFTMRW